MDDTVTVLITITPTTTITPTVTNTIFTTTTIACASAPSMNMSPLATPSAPAAVEVVGRFAPACCAACRSTPDVALVFVSLLLSCAVGVLLGLVLVLRHMMEEMRDSERYGKEEKKATPSIVVESFKDGAGPQEMVEFKV